MIDEYLCHAPQVKQFIREVQAVVARTPSTQERLAAIRPYFRELLLDPGWLPDDFRRTVAEGGMGHGIANWLLYRDLEGALSFSALVLPPGVATPVHDHLAWGLVGLYAGEQSEEVYEPDTPVAGNVSQAKLRLTAENELTSGSFYELIPPRGDIHRVVTTSAAPSISLHLLGNDVGCVLRHRFEPQTDTVIPFRSHYTNLACAEVGKVPH